jgi:hypothetical protein
MAPSNPNLTAIPEELITIIREGLDRPSLGNLRLACRALAEKSLFAFGPLDFRNVYIFLHPASLETFEKIARHPEYSKHVRTLTIADDCVREEHLSSGTTPALVQQAHTAMMDMRKEGSDMKRLVELLPLLPKLETILVTSLPFSLEGRGLGIHCGSRMLAPYDFDEWVHGDHHGYALSVVMNVMPEINCQARVDLRLRLDLRWNARKPPTGFVEIAPEKWKNLIPKLRRVQVEESLDCDTIWYNRLKQSITNVEGIELSISPESGQLADLPLDFMFPRGSFTELGFWPFQGTLCLVHVYIDMWGYERFFRKQRHGIQKLQLLKVVLWHFQLRGIPKIFLAVKRLLTLTSLYVEGLYLETSKSGGPEHDVSDSYGPWKAKQSLDLNDQGAIERAIEVLMGKPLLVPAHYCKEDEIIRQPRKSVHPANTRRLVDLRKAVAAAEGRI